jgi:periplasmic divalent cation tolerance protein
MEFRLVYSTAPDQAQALSLGQSLVESRLAACANVLPGMTSIYWWQGEIHRDQEAVLVLKTRAGLVDRLVAEVRRLHPYQVPCVVALPILEGNPDYLRWLGEETLEETTGPARG